MRAGRASAWLPWLAGYASLIAGILSLAVVPASAVGANATVILLAIMGMFQILWGAAYIFRQTSGLAWVGAAIHAASLAAAALGAVPVPSTGALGVTAIRVAAGLTCLLVLLGPGTPLPTSAGAGTTATRARLLAAAIGSAALLAFVWIAGAGLTLPFLRPPPAFVPGTAAETTPHPEPHPGAGEAHQSTFRVRLTGEPAGAYIVDAFTGPTEVGDLFVELRVENPAGLALEGLTIRVEALRGDGVGEPLIGTASPDQAQIPGDYALSLPVPTAGFWDVAATIDGPEGQASVAFSERVGGTANVAGWVLAGVPLVIARSCSGCCTFERRGAGEAEPSPWLRPFPAVPRFASHLPSSPLRRAPEATPAATAPPAAHASLIECAQAAMRRAGRLPGSSPPLEFDRIRAYSRDLNRRS